VAAFWKSETPAIMKVFCFLGPVDGKSRTEELALIELWGRSWSAQGWEPVVLTPDSLAKDRETKRMLRKFSRLPSINKRNLDMWCYARWLAVAQQGGGVMSDYDVINYGFLPRESGALSCHCGFVPCLMSGTAEEFLRAVGWFDRMKPAPLLSFKKTHASDMLVLKDRREEIIRSGECVNFGEDGWESAPAVHFSNFSMKPKNLVPRHEWIPRIRALDI
jgi:hypothetical protein